MSDLEIERLLKHYPDGLASRLEMMAWITEVVDHGVRRPGSDAGHRVEEWVAARFEYLGLEDVDCESFEVRAWDGGEARLVAWPAGRPDDTVELEGFPLPYTQGTEGFEADLVALGSMAGGVPAAGGDGVGGAIAVDLVEMSRLPESFMRQIATASHDPDGTLADYEHLLPFGPRVGREVETAMEAGAAGYVGVLAGMPWDTRDYYVPYDGIERPLPAIWVDRTAGGALLDMLAQGPVRGRIEATGEVADGSTSNVVGMLPGASDQWVVIGSHHDAPWASAVEDGTGIALVLAQARFWAQVPQEERPHNLLFLLNGAHMVGGSGLLSFLDTHGDLLDQIVLAVHLEHAAAAWEVHRGELRATDEPEARWWFTSRDPALEAAVAGALEAEELGRSWILPPDAFGAFPPTDGGGFHLHGVPLMDFLTAPVYLFDSADTLDKVHEPSLEPITRATIRIVGSMAGRSVAEVRAACARAAARARASGPPTG